LIMMDRGIIAHDFTKDAKQALTAESLRTLYHLKES